MQRNRKIIIWAFSGTGKSTIADGNERILDVDNAYFRFYAFDFILSQDIQQKYRDMLYKPYPMNLIEFVKTVDADIVLLNCHTSFLKHFTNVYLVYPRADLKETFLTRYKARGDNASYIAYMTDTYEEILDALAELPYPQYIISDEHTYLKDIILDEKGEVNLCKFSRNSVQAISMEGR